MNRVTPSCIFPWLKAAVCMLCLLCLSGVANAVQPIVKTVPWVAANPLIPHDTWSGKTIRLKGTADLKGSAASNFEFTWDFGDGTPVATGTVSNPYAIEAQHAYTGSAGTVFTAILTVREKSTGDNATANYYVEIQDKTLKVEVNVAIDEGLWYLHKSMARTTVSGTSGTENAGHWESGCGYGGYNCTTWVAITPANLLAFEVNGHLPTGDAGNPYIETVQRALRWLFTRLTPESLSLQTYPAPTGQVNPDSNGNGIGIRVNQGNYPYQGGMFIDAIIASGTPEATTTTGPANVAGRKYKDIVQDMADSYAYGQYNSGVNRGGWRYSWNEGPDNSACQWAAIGLIPAEWKWSLPVPQWLKNENLVWLQYSQAANGSFGYTSSGIQYRGANALTASGMVQLALDGIGRGNARWDKAETFLRDNRFCGTPFNVDNNIRAYYYALFSFTKGMLLHDSNGDKVAEPLVCLQSQTPNVVPIDWYGAESGKPDLKCNTGANAPCDGVARTLVKDQNAGGYWYGGADYSDVYPFATGWAITMLNRTVFETGQPVAVAKATPNPGVAGQTITLDGSESFHQDPNFVIDSWEWDLNSDGVYDRSGPVVNTSFPAVGDYPVTLKVTDNDGSPGKEDTTVITVRITTPPVAPTANAGGPYVFCPGAKPWFLNGTGSINPDEGQSEPGKPGDTIQSYEWDLDGNGQFNDATGAQPNVTTFFEGKGPGGYVVQLKVTDTTATSFPSSGQPNLSDTDSAQVTVKSDTDPVCQSCTNLNLAARPKSGKVQLTWTATGAHHYNVYRSTVQGGPYTFLATTASTYSTYLDVSVVNGTTYYYVVRPATLNNAETCQSNEASAKPTGR